MPTRKEDPGFSLGPPIDLDDDISQFDLDDAEEGRVGAGGPDDDGKSSKSLCVTLILAIFLGTLGMDWFYLGCGNMRWVYFTFVIIVQL
jgi:hypothetical protein